MELSRGVLVCYGQFDERDREIVKRTYPGRRIVLCEDGAIEVHPSSEAASADLYAEAAALAADPDDVAEGRNVIADVSAVRLHR